MKMFRAMIGAQANVLSVSAQRATGSARMEIGISGSGALRSRMTNRPPIARDIANSARIGGEVQGYCLPPRVSAIMKAMLAAMIEAAPIKSRRCGRSKRGSRRSRADVMASAMRPSGILSQKIADQCTYSCDESAKRRAACARCRIGQREIRIIAPAVLGCCQVAEHHHAHRGQAAAADAVDHPSPTISNRRLGASAQHERADDVHRIADHQRDAAADDVADLAVERGHRSRSNQIGGDQPRQQMRRPRDRDRWSAARSPGSSSRASRETPAAARRRRSAEPAHD